MLSLSVYILGGSKKTVATARYAVEGMDKVAVEACNQSELKEKVGGTESDLIHIVPDEAVVMPAFYKAMLNYIEHSQRDYVFCSGVRVVEGTVEELSPADNNFSCGQMIVRAWVVKELGAGVQDLNKLSRRIINEYRGVEIPHHLYMEM